jgi:hypothetical protein
MSLPTSLTAFERDVTVTVGPVRIIFESEEDGGFCLGIGVGDQLCVSCSDAGGKIGYYNCF